jgi:hypothetical protein
LVAIDPEGRWNSVQEEGVWPGTDGVVLAFSVGPNIDITVNDVRDLPVTEYIISVETYDDGVVVGSRAETISDEAGVSQVRVPSRRFAIQVDSTGFTSARLGPYDPATVPGILDVRLEPSPGIRGIVFGDGLGVRGARVGIFRAAGPDTWIVSNGFPSLMECKAEAMATTRQGGYFFFEPEVSGGYFVRCEAEGYCASTIGPIEVENQDVKDEVFVTLGRGGDLRVSLRFPDDYRPGERWVGISQGDGRFTAAMVGEDDVVVFSGVAPGDWMVRELKDYDPSKIWNRVTNMPSNRKPRIQFDCTVLEGVSSSYILYLE